MSSSEISHYDLILIGAGQGGLPAAHMAARLGAKVALIEMREVVASIRLSPPYVMLFSAA